MTVGIGKEADIEEATSVLVGTSETVPQDGGSSNEQPAGRATSKMDSADGLVQKMPATAAEGELGRGIPEPAHGAPFPPPVLLTKIFLPVDLIVFRLRRRERVGRGGG